jgi:PPK2 family polyphosphate:nucleotide phosphotransferase
MIKKLRAQTDGSFRLKKREPDETHGVSKKEAERSLVQHIAELQELHDLLYAQNRRALLIVLQGMDAAGKDGAIRHVMSGVNPQGCAVTSFKQPSRLELAHDFLWRIHAAVPPAGAIGIFNRSHYEDVLIARVHDLVPKSVWSRRFDQINNFEEMLAENNVCLLKFFLHISSTEQERRFAERLNDPEKNWKLSAADFSERKYWDDYQDAYQDAIAKCSTAHAPWYVIPSDHKWFRNYAVSEIIIAALQSFHMKFPKPDPKKLESLTAGISPAGILTEPKSGS